MSACANSRLEDFGARGTVSPQERLREYQRQCRGLRKTLQAEFWLGVLERDPEVRALAGVAPAKRRQRRRGMS